MHPINVIQFKALGSQKFKDLLVHIQGTYRIGSRSGNGSIYITCKECFYYISRNGEVSRNYQGTSKRIRARTAGLKGLEYNINDLLMLYNTAFDLIRIDYDNIENEVFKDNGKINLLNSTEMQKIIMFVFLSPHLYRIATSYSPEHQVGDSELSKIKYLGFKALFKFFRLDLQRDFIIK